MTGAERVGYIKENFSYGKKIEHIEDLLMMLQDDFDMKFTHTDTDNLNAVTFMRTYRGFDGEGNMYKLFVMFFYNDKISMFTIETVTSFSHYTPYNKPSEEQQKMFRLELEDFMKQTSRPPIHREEF